LRPEIAKYSASADWWILLFKLLVDCLEVYFGFLYPVLAVGLSSVALRETNRGKLHL
jgi:hypothetical protein